MTALLLVSHHISPTFDVLLPNQRVASPASGQRPLTRPGLITRGHCTPLLWSLSTGSFHQSVMAASLAAGLGLAFLSFCYCDSWVCLARLPPQAMTTVGVSSTSQSRQPFSLVDSVIFFPIRGQVCSLTVIKAKILGACLMPMPA